MLHINPEHILPQLLLKCWPFPRGQGRITDRLFSNLIFKDDIAKIKTSDGFWITVAPNDHIGRQLYLTGEFDRTTFEVVEAFSRSGDLLLDIGANVGYVSACFLHRVPNSTAIAVEPEPKTATLLRENLSQFKNRFSVHEFALSDKNSAQYLNLVAGNMGANHLSEVETQEPSILVQTKKTSDFIRSLPNPPSLIKVDVEGHEPPILKNVLNSVHVLPRAIIYENKTQDSAPDRELGSLFAKHGYKVFGIRKHLTALEYVAITSLSQCEMDDYVAIHGISIRS